jgi:hypothetical protein
LQARARKLKEKAEKDDYEKEMANRARINDSIYKGAGVKAEQLPGFPELEFLKTSRRYSNMRNPVFNNGSGIGMLQTLHRNPFREFTASEQYIVRLTTRMKYMRLATMDTKKLRGVLKRIRTAIPEMNNILKHADKEYLGPGGRLTLFRDLITAGEEHLNTFIFACCTPDAFEKNVTTDGKAGWTLKKPELPPNNTYSNPFTFPTAFNDDYNSTVVVEKFQENMPAEEENDPDNTIPFMYLREDVPAVPTCSKEAARGLNEMHAVDVSQPDVLDYVRSVMDRVGCADPSQRRKDDVQYDFYTFFRRPDPVHLKKLGMPESDSAGDAGKSAGSQTASRPDAKSAEPAPEPSQQAGQADN